MTNVNAGRLLLAAAVTFVAFIVTEFVVENFVHLVLNVSERDLWAGHSGVTLSGLRYHILNLTIFLAICVVIMSLYALIRPNFGSLGKTVAATSAGALWYDGGRREAAARA